MVPVLAVQTLSVSDSELGVLMAIAGGVPALLAASLGVLADRSQPYRSLHLANLVRAAIMGLFTWAIVTGSLSIWLLTGVMLATEILSTYYDSLMTTVTPRLVPKAQLTKANAYIEGAATVTSSAGEALGGVLLTVAGSVLITVLNAGSYIVSSLALALFVKPGELARTEPPHPAERRPRPMVGAATAHLADLKRNFVIWSAHGVLVRLAIAGTLFNIGLGFVTTLLAPYALNTIGMPVWVFGLLMLPAVLLGVGSPALIGLAVPRLGLWGTVLLAQLLAVAGFIAIATAGSFPNALGIALLSVGLALVDFAAIASLVIARSARQQIIPHDVLAGVSGLVRTLTWGFDPIASLTAGIMSSYLLGRQVTIWMAPLFAVVAVFVVLSLKGQGLAELEVDVD
jgi:hypothetical protein